MAVGDDDGTEHRPSLPRFTLKELFQGNTPEQWRSEYAGAFNWGPDIGREIVEE